MGEDASMEAVKKIVMVLVAAALLFTLLQESVYAKERKVNFKVDGVTCLSIAYTVEGIPKQIDGVQSSKYDFSEDGVTVVFDDAKVSIEDITGALEKENFPMVEEPFVMN
jgi:copper chaperone CopZ